VWLVSGWGVHHLLIGSQLSPFGCAGDFTAEQMMYPPLSDTHEYRGRQDTETLDAFCVREAELM
jgi:hypothetical protein